MMGFHLLWRFPESWGEALVIIHFVDRIFPEINHPANLGIPHGHGNLHISPTSYMSDHRTSHKLLPFVDVFPPICGKSSEMVAMGLALPHRKVEATAGSFQFQPLLLLFHQLQEFGKTENNNPSSDKSQQ